MIDFIKYLSSRELSTGLLGKQVESICRSIFDTVGFIHKITELANHQRFGNNLPFIAMFISRVLAIKDERDRANRYDVKELISTINKDADPVTKTVLLNSFIISEEIEELMPQHDNDFPHNFKNIKIFPTVDELSAEQLDFTNYRGWLGEELAVHAAHIDRQFRLLREDFVTPLKDEIRNIQIPNGGQRKKLQYKNPVIAGLCIEDDSSRGPCLSVQFDLPEKYLSVLIELKKEKEISNYLEDEGARIFARDSIILFFDRSKKLKYIGIISQRNSRSIAKEIFEALDKEKTLTITVGVWFETEVMVSLMSGQIRIADFAVIAKSSFFSFEPILVRLQGNLSLLIVFLSPFIAFCLPEMNKVLFEEEFLSEHPTVTIVHPDSEVSDGLRRFLDQDISQMSAADSAMKQRVTLIQGKFYVSLKF